MWVNERCKNCNGSGYTGYTDGKGNDIRCPVCGGSGEVMVERKDK